MADATARSWTGIVHGWPSPLGADQGGSRPIFRRVPALPIPTPPQGACMSLVRGLALAVIAALPLSSFAAGGHDSVGCTGCHSIHTAKGDIIFAVTANKQVVNPKTKQPYAGTTALCLGCHEESSKGGQGYAPISAHMSHPYGLASVDPKIAKVPPELLREGGRFECLGLPRPASVEPVLQVPPGRHREGLEDRRILRDLPPDQGGQRDGAGEGGPLHLDGRDREPGPLGEVRRERGEDARRERRAEEGRRSRERSREEEEVGRDPLRVSEALRLTPGGLFRSRPVDARLASPGSSRPRGPLGRAVAPLRALGRGGPLAVLAARTVSPPGRPSGREGPRPCGGNPWSPGAGPGRSLAALAARTNARPALDCRAVQNRTGRALA